MTNRDMLAEAIADAKALKETAIANAKAALEEAFEPRLKSMLSAKLQEMEDEDLKEVEDEMTEAKKEYKDDDRKDGGESKETKRTEKMKYGKDLAEGDDEMDLDELLAELDEDARTDAEEEGYEDGMKDEKEDMEDDMEDEEIDLEDMSEEDLKSFIEDVIADMVTSGELEAGEEFEVEDEVEDDEDIDVEDETEVDVAMNEVDGFNPTKTGDYELDRARAKGQLESKEDMEEGIADKLKAVWNDPEMLGKIITVDGKKMSLKDFLGMAGSAATGGMAKSGAGKTSSIGEDARTDAEEEGYLDGMKDEKEDMDKMKKEIKELRSDLHETNLLNAKLLYTNKIFRAKNLKEAQKVKVLEAFDKASNVSEVKLIFETLNEGMVANTTTATPLRENLGRASKAAGVAPSKQPIMEIDPQVARWQKLAGIK
jgi:hypothetical protein